VLVVALVLAGGAAGLAWMQVRAEKVEDVDWTRETGPVVATPTLPEAGTPSEPAEAAPGAAPGAAVGSVVLDVRSADFRVRPGDPGEPVRVNARYDTSAYELTREESVAEDGTWVYRVAFRRTANGLITTIKEMLGGTRPEVEIALPPDVPLDLRAKATRGGLEAQLGGLWLVDVDLEGTQGGFVVGVDEPAAVPVERMRVRASMGGLVLGKVGNLSPRALDVDVRLGGGVVDLRGAWQADAAITVANSNGGVQMIVPEEIATRGLPVIPGAEGGPAPPPEEAELPGPVLTFELSGDLEDIEVQRR
jgi:hypothetical protein